VPELEFLLDPLECTYAVDCRRPEFQGALIVTSAGYSGT
jgi:hypothetical protein